MVSTTPLPTPPLNAKFRNQSDWPLTQWTPRYHNPNHSGTSTSKKPPRKYSFRIPITKLHPAHHQTTIDPYQSQSSSKNHFISPFKASRFTLFRISKGHESKFVQTTIGRYSLNATPIVTAPPLTTPVKPLKFHKSLHSPISRRPFPNQKGLDSKYMQPTRPIRHQEKLPEHHTTSSCTSSGPPHCSLAKAIPAPSITSAGRHCQVLHTWQFIEFITSHLKLN